MSNFSIDKCREDGWRCEVRDTCTSSYWREAKYGAGCVDGSGFHLCWVKGEGWQAFGPECLRNLPREPKVRRANQPMPWYGCTVPIISHDDGKTWKLDREKIAREEVVAELKRTLSIPGFYWSLVQDKIVDRIAELEKEAE